MRKAVLFFTLVAICALSASASVVVVVVPPKGELLEGTPVATVTTVDSTFQFGETNVTDIRDLKLFPDGRIVYAGAGYYESVGIANPTGAVAEGSFGGMDMTTAISLDLDPKDGAIYAAGMPRSASLPGFVRVVNFDDPGWYFRGVNGGTGMVAVVLADRQVLAGGAFRVGSDTNYYGLVRRDLSGAASFVYTNTLGLQIENAVVLADGSVIATWLRTNGNLVSSEVGRWTRDGERDAAYNGLWAEGFGTNSQVTALVKAPGTNGVVAAVRTEPGGGAGPGGPVFTKWVTLDEVGNVVGWNNELPMIAGTVNAIGFEVVTPETAASGGYDRLLLGGEFNFHGSNEVKNLVSVAKTGELAWGFAADEGPSGPVHAVAVQLDGKILIGGTFTNVSGVEAKGLARIHGGSATGASYLYWADAEFRAFEKLGEGRIVLRRSGDVSQALVVNVAAVHDRSPSALNVPSKIEFAPGEREAVGGLGLLNNSQRWGRERVEITATVTNANVLVTRAKAAVVVMDDETPGTLDPKFNVALSPDKVLFAFQEDGKIIFGGWGTGLVRLNPDGSLDSTFITNGLPGAATALIHQILPQADGKIYVAGQFNTTPASTYGINHVARLNADGTLDRSFDPRLTQTSLGAMDHVKLLVLTNGDVLVWTGGLIRREGMFLQGILRLNSKGEYLGSFQGVSSFRNPTEWELVPTGEVITAGGNIGAYPNLVKYNANGGVASGFPAGLQAKGGYVSDIEIEDGSFLIAGSFNAVGTNAVTNLARLNLQDGAVDTNFVATVNAQVNVVRRHGGKIYIGGDFTEVNGKQRIRIARLNLDGTLDESFDPGFGPNRALSILEFQADGKLIIGNLFDRVDGVNAALFARLETEQSSGEIRLVSRRIEVSETNAFVNFEFDRIGGSAGELSATVETVDGSALAGRDYVATSTNVFYADGEIGRKVVRVQLLGDPNEPGAKTFSLRVLGFPNSTEATVLLEDAQQSWVEGTIDFPGGTNEVRDIGVGGDGFVYLAGHFTNISGVAVTNLARLWPNLALDTSFALEELPRPLGFSPEGENPYAPLLSVAVRPDGRVLFSGNFYSVGTNNWRYIAQVNEEGVYDGAFSASNMVTSGVTAPAQGLYVQADGKVIANVGSGLRRLNLNGTRDQTFGGAVHGNTVVVHGDGTLFANGTGNSVTRSDETNQSIRTLVTVAHRSTSGALQAATIRAMAIDSAGAILIGGDFTHLNQTNPAPRLARILTNGVIDTNFIANVGVSGLTPRDMVTAIEVLANGDILVGGKFAEVQGVERRTLALLAPDGTLRDQFDPLVDGDGIAEFEGTPDGGVVVRGSVTAVDGSPVGDVFKLAFTAPVPPVAKFLWPTNGAEVPVSDVPELISLHAFDPDGFLERVVLELDGQAVATNTAGNVPIPVFLPRGGEHQLRVIATDDRGLTTTETITFQTVEVSFPGLLAVTKTAAGVVVDYNGARLQGSVDLENWTDVHFGGGEYVAPATDEYRFFRAAN
jgi:uncharacterized delta-60 repeat protein